MLNPVKFGTSGHRGIINETFTIAHVKAISYAVATLLKKKHNSVKLVIGYDPRKGNSTQLEDHSFTKVIVDTLLNQGVDVDFYNIPVPTPLISKHINVFNSNGGLILTASHNPPEYNGIKFNPENGAPAPENITIEIEKIANTVLEKELIPAEKKGTLKILNTTDWFTKQCIKMLSKWFFNVSLKNISVACDTKHGTCARVWKELLRELSISNFEILHEENRSDFGGIEPNPTHAEGLSKFKSYIKKQKKHLGISNDPDGDRFSIIDNQGSQLIPEEATAIIVHYLVQKNMPISGIVTTVASSGLIKSICNKHQLLFFETAVGFKHFAPYFEKANIENKYMFGVESSGGLTVSKHTFEKCGFFPGLCLMYILSETGKTLAELKSEIIQLFGKFYFEETAVKFESTIRNTIIQRLKNSSKVNLTNIFSNPIHSINQIDGLKIIFNETSWVLIRLSGTEPVARIYSESLNQQEAVKNLNEAKSLLVV